ncbi:MAG: phosphotransferase [Thermomicrobiales bacterium]|nr:phosphotransferase [Thermomicrobiales bacterium]
MTVSALAVLGEGWDSVAILMNDELVVRFPKRAEIGRMLWRERLLLGAIADRLPAPVPRYTHVSNPIPGFEYGIAVYPLIVGRPLNADVVNVKFLAIDLARFLAALHGVELEIAMHAGFNDVTPEEWWSERSNLFERAWPVIESSLPATVSSGYATSWTEARNAASRSGFSPCLVHMDLGTEHVLLTPAGRVAGIIDFGDAGPGDPAIDMAGLPDSLAQAVLQRYTADPSQRQGLWVRRRFYRLTVPLHAIAASFDLDRPDLLREGLSLVEDAVLRSSQ